MSTRHQKSFVLALFVAVAILFTLSSSASAAEAIHNLILIIPESLPAAGIDQSNAPALARLRRDGVTFANSHAGFPRLTPPDSLVDTSDLTPSSLIAAADAEDYTVGFMTDEGDVGAALQQLVDRTQGWLGLFGQILTPDKWKVLPLGSTRVRHSASVFRSSISFHRLHSHTV